ncbi:hypothetical protein M422DRAFT_109402, partial [Sphaerobolus stellatus SS14]
IHWFLYDGRERENRGQQYNLPNYWIRNVRADLMDVNPYVRHLRLFHQVNEGIPTAIELTEASSNGDFAAVIHAGNTTNVQPRSILIWRNSDDEPSFMSIYSWHYEPLQFPLLFPHGTLGWGLPNSAANLNLDADDENVLGFTQMQWYRNLLLTDDRFLRLGRLTSEYLCDMYSRIEEQRLQYILRNQPGGNLTSRTNSELPASFLGSRRWSSENTADGLALARVYGRGTFWITFTTNPNWPEIQRRLAPGQTAVDVPTVVARAFKQRLNRFLNILRKKFGKLIYIIQVIEFQLRGFPHAHIICKIHPELPPDCIDHLITCQLPTDNPSLRAKVWKWMRHNEDHLTRENSRCNRNGKCIYGFPHPITEQTWIDESTGRVHFKRLTEEERWIAPHVPEFIDQFDCHIYFDVSSTVQVFMYMYKYVFKGPDHINFQIQNPEREKNLTDEVNDYINGRYLSATEAAWRILGFQITSKKPAVTCLPVHLPNQNRIQFNQGQNRQTSTVSNLIRYFFRPLDPNFNALLYTEYFQQYVHYPYRLNEDLRDDETLEQIIPGTSARHKISKRMTGEIVARLQTIPLTAGETFYLRALLAHRPARSFQDLRTIGNNVYSTFHEAAIAFGLFHDHNEGYYALQEAVASFSTPGQL